MITKNEPDVISRPHSVGIAFFPKSTLRFSRLIRVGLPFSRQSTLYFFPLNSGGYPFFPNQHDRNDHIPEIYSVCLTFFFEPPLLRSQNHSVGITIFPKPPLPQAQTHSVGIAIFPTPPRLQTQNHPFRLLPPPHLW